MRTSAGRLILVGFGQWLAIFAIASALDLFLTWVLLKDGAAVEVNPLADQILALFGWWGLGLFKAATVAVVLGVAFILGRKNRLAARRLLQFSSCILVLVVAFSSYQLARVEAASNRLLAKEKVRREGIAQKRACWQKYFHKVHQLTGELVQGKVTLPLAARDLARFLPEIQDAPLPFLQSFAPGFSLESSLAIHLVHNAGFQLIETPQIAQALLPAWQSEFVSAFDSPLPEFAMWHFPKEGTGNPSPNLAWMPFAVHAN